MKIGTKLMLAAVVGVVCIVLVVSLAAYRIGRRALERGVSSHLESVAQSRAAHVETFLRQHRETVRMGATSVVLPRALESLEAGDGAPASIVRDMNARLQRFVEPGGCIYEMLVLDRRGVVVASTRPGDIGLDMSTNAYFTGAREGPFIKDAYRSPTTGRDSLAVSAPMLSGDGEELLGVLVARVDMAALNAIVTDRTGMGGNGETYLINRYGFMITPSRFLEDTFLKLKVDSENARDCLADMEAMRWGRPAEEHEQHEALVCTDYRGRTVLGVHAHVPEMPWGLLAEMDAEEAFAPIARLRTTIVALAAVLAVVWLALAHLLAGRISRPIHELHAGSERIGAGELDYRVAINTGDEIEQLADEFNRMAARLSESYASLEQKVVDRTAELATEKDRLRITLTSIGDAVIAVDALGRVTLMNPVAERLTGCPAAESVGRPLAEVFNIVNEETRRPAADPVARACREGRVVGLANHTVLIARDGAEYAIADSAAPIRDEAGRIIGVVLVFRDVTEERKAQGEIRRLAMIAEQAVEGIMVTDLDGNITFVNAAWAGMHGCERAELIGRHPSDFYSEEQAETELMPLVEKARLKGHHRGVVEHVRKDGTTFPAQMTCSVLTDDEGRPMGMIDFATDVTERKRAEDELRRLAMIAEQAAEGIAVADLDGNITYVNAAWSRMHGYEPAELIGEHLSVFHNQEQLKSEVIPFNQQVQRAGHHAGEVGHVRRDGTAFPTQMMTTVFKDEQGRPIGMIGFATDITERKRAEDELGASENRYRTLLENLPQKIFLKDRNSVYVTCNENYAADLGIKAEEIAGKTDHDFFPRQLVEKYLADDKSVIESGETLDVEEVYVKEGQETVVHTVKTPLKDGQGNVIAVLGVFWDITGRKRAEAALAEAARQWQDTFDAMDAMVAIVDTDYSVLRANRAMREAFADRKVVGAHCYELMHGTGEPPPFCPSRDTFESGQPAHCEVLEQHLGGRWFDVSAYPLRHDRGTVQQVVHVVRDITERKRAEERLEALNAELQRSNRDLQDFTYTISHDLQEPLRKIHTFGQFLMEDCGEHLPQAGREHLRRMQDAALRMRDLIRHLLDLARVGTRGKELAPVDPRVAVDQALEDLSEQIRECGGEVTVEAELPTVMADAVQLTQLFQNLIGNAVKFRSPDRAPKVTVTARVEAGRAVFSVADNGIGIEERYFERIFGVFQRLHTREEYEGVGVGLALCERIVRRHGGTIRAESEPGKGSVFHFTLPAAPETREENP